MPFVLITIFLLSSFIGPYPYATHFTSTGDPLWGASCRRFIEGFQQAQFYQISAVPHCLCFRQRCVLTLHAHRIIKLHYSSCSVPGWAPQTGSSEHTLVQHSLAPKASLCMFQKTRCDSTKMLKIKISSHCGHVLDNLLLHPLTSRERWSSQRDRLWTRLCKHRPTWWRLR